MTFIFAAGLVFTRIAALFMTLPVTSARGVPKGVPVLLALATTAVVLPNVSPVDVDGGLLFPLAGELILGLIGGLTVRAVFSSLGLAGEVMGMQMGFAMAQIFDPVQKTSQGPVAMLSTMLAVAMFLQFDLHVVALGLVIDSFQSIPPGTFEILSLNVDPYIQAVGKIFRFGLQLAGPVLILTLLINVLVGILGKLAPRMNVFFSVGPVLTTVGGIALLTQALPSMLLAHLNMVKDALTDLGLVLGL